MSTVYECTKYLVYEKVIIPMPHMTIFGAARDGVFTKTADTTNQSTDTADGKTHGSLNRVMPISFGDH